MIASDQHVAERTSSREEIFLPSARSAFVFFAAAKLPTADLVQAAKEAADAADFAMVNASAESGAPAAALSAIAYASDAAAYNGAGMDAAAYSAVIAFSADLVSRPTGSSSPNVFTYADFWSAKAWGLIQDDTEAFDAGGTPWRLPLFGEYDFDWNAEPVRDMHRAMLSEGAHWQVFLDWFQDRLDGDEVAEKKGRPSIPEMEIEIATISDEDWKKGSQHVFGLIREIQEKYWNNAGSGETNELTEQVPAPHRFWIGERIEAAPLVAPASDADLSREIARALRVKAEKAKAHLVGNHADPDVLDAIEELEVALSEEPLSVGSLLMAYRSLEAAAASYFDAGSERERGIVSRVGNLVRSLDDLLQCYPANRAIEANRLATQLQTSGIEAYRTEVGGLIAAAKKSDEVAASAIKALEAGLPQIDRLTKQMDALQHDTKALAVVIEQRAVLASTHSLDVRNFGAVIVEFAEAKKAVRRDKAVGTGRRIGKAALRGVEKGLEEGVSKVTSAAMVVGVTSLVGWIAGPFAAMAVYVAGLRPLSKRIDELNSSSGDDGQSPDDDVTEA